MSSTTAPAVCYLVYALCFVIFLGSMGRQTSSEMSSATLRRFRETPFRSKPDRTLHDVRGPEQVYEWVSKVFVPQLYSDDDLLSEVSTGSPLNLTIGEYSVVLLGRATLKRHQIVSHDAKAFSNAYSVQPAGRISAYDSASSSENMSTFGDQSSNFAYSTNGGLNGAGGFVKFLDFGKRDEVEHLFAELYNYSWFDLRQSSFALELIFFNGNVNKFLAASFVFEHDYTGKTQVTMEVAPLDLTLHDHTKPETWVRFAVYLIIVFLFGYFVKREAEEISGGDIMGYLSNVLTLMHLVSLAMCLYCMIVYLTVVISYTYLHFSFPDYQAASGELSPAETMRVREGNFQDLTNLAFNMEHFMGILSVSVFLVCLRCCSELTVLVPQCGLAINTMLNVRFHLMSFIVVFAATLLSFTFAAYIIFGPRVEAFSTIPGAIISAIRMVLREPVVATLQEGDSNFGYTFFIFFHVFFLVVQQVVLSIWMYGYFKEREDLERLADSDRFPLLRIFRRVTRLVRENATFINRCFTRVQQALFGPPVGGAASRINFEQVASLRERRTTQLRTRFVFYEQKQDDDGEQFDLLKDIQFRAAPPLYPGGMMQFYVEKVTTGGPAGDAGIQPGFRLVEIKMSGYVDRGEKFRNEAAAKDPLKYLRDLKKLPLRLRFEGRSQTFSWECVFWLIFTVVFVCFTIMVSRRGDSHLQYRVHEQALTTPKWAVQNPARSLDFQSIRTMDDVAGWIDAAVVGTEFDCTAGIGDLAADACSTAPGLNTDERRSNWFLWRGVGVESGLPGDVLEGRRAAAVTSAPAAAHGLSLGFVPFVAPLVLDAPGTLCATEDLSNPTRCSCSGFVRFGVMGSNFSDWRKFGGSVECSQNVFGDPVPGMIKRCFCKSETATREHAVHVSDYNLGVMANNFVRLTFQVPCFTKNPADQSKFGYPFILSDESIRRDCSDAGCMFDALKEKRLCLNKEGDAYDPEYGTLTGNWSGVTYRYSETGTYRNLGGFAVGFGSTPAEAAAVAEILRNDGVLSKYANSAVFELVTYNPNYDLFSFAKVAFDVRATGRMERQLEIRTFPLRLFSMGSVNLHAGEASVLWVLFVTIWLLFALFTFYILRDIWTQHCISKALLKSWGHFAFDWFLEDWWNLLDAAIWYLTLDVIATLLSFALIDGKSTVRGGVSSWTTDFSFTLQRSLSDVDAFEQFERAATLFGRFEILASLDSLFIVLKLAKYFSGIVALRMMMTSIGKAIQELIMVLCVAFCAFTGMVLMFFIHFGIIFPSCQSVSAAFSNMFMFIMGRFGVDNLIRWSPIFSLFFFPVFAVLLFLLMNMLLAAIVFSWKDTRRDAQELSLRSAFAAVRESVAKGSKYVTDEAEDLSSVKLDVDFWQKLSILRFLSTLDDTGKVTVHRVVHGSDGGRKLGGEDSEHDGEGGGGDEDGGDGFRHFDNHDDAKRFLKVFRKAHMELASKLCREVDTASAGVDDDACSPTARSRELILEGVKRAKHEEQRFIGIVEDELPQEQAESIVRDLQRKMTELEHVSEEVWLDALLTALEARGIEQLQRTFLPVPGPMPKKQQEWNAFKERQMNMQRRLDTFLQLLMQHAKLQHFVYLSEMAADKERVLKQQSLVLTDYLETLDEQIKKVGEETQELDHDKGR